jgi:hypothetical protein
MLSRTTSRLIRKFGTFKKSSGDKYSSASSPNSVLIRRLEANVKDPADSFGYPTISSRQKAQELANKEQRAVYFFEKGDQAQLDEYEIIAPEKQSTAAISNKK